MSQFFKVYGNNGNVELMDMEELLAADLVGEAGSDIPANLQSAVDEYVSGDLAHCDSRA